MDRISAFMDGESGQTETRQSMQRLKQDDECEETHTADTDDLVPVVANLVSAEQGLPVTLQGGAVLDEEVVDL